MEQYCNRFLLVIAAACRLVLHQHFQSSDAYLLGDEFIPTQSLSEEAIPYSRTTLNVMLSYDHTVDFST